MKGPIEDNYLDLEQAAPEADLLLKLLEFSEAGADSEWLAEVLLAKFNDIKGVINAPSKEFQGIEGLPPSLITLVKLIRRIVDLYEQAPVIPRDLLKNPKTMEHYLIARMKGVPAERILFIFLDDHGTVLGEKALGAGTVSQTIIFPREIMRECLNFNATGLIVAHNHPHGPPIPSEADRQSASQMKRLLAPFGVVLKDSIVVGARRCFSILKNGPL
jgi:DNA repair protein RadC